MNWTTKTSQNYIYSYYLLLNNMWLGLGEALHCLNKTKFRKEKQTVKFSLNPKNKQWTTGDSGKFEHTDYMNLFMSLWVFEFSRFYCIYKSG